MVSGRKRSSSGSSSKPKKEENVIHASSRFDMTRRPRDVLLRIKAELSKTNLMRLTQVFALLLIIVGILLLVYVNFVADTDNLIENVDIQPSHDRSDDADADQEEIDGDTRGGSTHDSPGDEYD